MQVKIVPGIARGTVQAPPSKSMAHRYLIAAALAEGKSVISGVEYSQDILATIDCLRALGVHIEMQEDRVTIWGGGKLQPCKDLLCRESGSTLRFMLPLCLLTGTSATLKGSDRLMERPLTVYEDLCRAKGFSFSRCTGSISVSGRLQSGAYSVDGSVSSQFITGLIFALLCCEGESRITLTGKVESRSYIDLTLAALREFSFSVAWAEENALVLCGGGGVPRQLSVEGDYSNAAFLDALNLLGGKVCLQGLKEESLQGDRVYRKYFEKLKAGTPTLSLADCPDLGPILMAVAAAFHGARFTDTARLKIKESDRGAVMARELQKYGAQVDLLENEIIVHAGALRPADEPFWGHNDHRIVMSLAVLCTKLGGVINGAQAVNKSFPGFFEKLGSLGIEVEINEAE